jgi:hypothetical protein
MISFFLYEGGFAMISILYIVFFRIVYYIVYSICDEKKKRKQLCNELGQ